MILNRLPAGTCSAGTALKFSESEPVLASKRDEMKGSVYVIIF